MRSLVGLDLSCNALEIKMATNQEDRVPAQQPGPGKGAEDADLVPRPDNIGQSRRWRREDKGATEAERGRYGKEESQHSTEQGSPDPGSPPTGGK